MQPRPATPTVAFRRWGAEASRATRCHLSCPFTQTPLMERREDSPSSRNSHRLPGRDLDVPECAHHVSASTRAGLHTRAPLCVCIPGHACLSGSVRLGQARFYQAGRWAPPPRGLPGLDASQPGELCSAQRVGSTWKRKGETPAVSFGLRAVSISQSPAQGKRKCEGLKPGLAFRGGPAGRVPADPCV